MVHMVICQMATLLSANMYTSYPPSTARTAQKVWKYFNREDVNIKCIWYVPTLWDFPSWAVEYVNGEFHDELAKHIHEIIKKGVVDL